MLQQVSRLIRPVEPLLVGRRLLEVGSARGHLLFILSKMGFDARGIELSSEAAELSRQHLDVIVDVGTVEEFALRSDRRVVDLIVSSCVLEHVADPGAFVQACARLLAPNGILVMDTPNVASANVTRLGKAWEYFQKYHVYLFSQGSARKLVTRSGLEFVRCFSYNNVLTPDRACRHLKRNRLALLALDWLRLYHIVRRLYRGRRPEGEEAWRPIRALTAEEIHKQPCFEQTTDATGPLAAGCRGDHIVLIARRVGAGAASNSP